MAERSLLKKKINTLRKIHRISGSKIEHNIPIYRQNTKLLLMIEMQNIVLFHAAPYVHRGNIEDNLYCK